MEPIFQGICLLTLILPHIYLFLNKLIRNEKEDNIFKCVLQKNVWFYDISAGTVNKFTLLNSKWLRFFHFLKHIVLFPCYHRTICSSPQCLFICVLVLKTVLQALFLFFLFLSLLLCFALLKDFRASQQCVAMIKRKCSNLIPRRGHLTSDLITTITYVAVYRQVGVRKGGQVVISPGLRQC